MPKIQAIDEELNHSIVDWVWEFYKLGMICGVVDSKLNENYNKDDAERALLTGITPESNPPGEGLAFILAKDLDYFPMNSYGQWLGIVNSTTNGSSNNPIVAIEFDTKKSYPEDLDDNHVGVDINSVYSVSQNSIGLNISSATDKVAMVNYNGTTMDLSVYLFEGNDTSKVNYTKDLVLYKPSFDLSIYLPDEVYVGFAASTGIDIQLNCVRAWYFTGADVVHFPTWVWPVVSLGGAVLILAIGYYIYRRIKKGKSDDADQGEEFALEDEIEIGKMGPKKYELKELKSATDNFNARNELGRGGFGVVYKGILKGEEMAVKRVWKNNQRGRKNMIAEITTIGSLHHKNVVKLIGWCYECDELLLVYEHMPNGSLDKVLYPEGRLTQSTMSWKRRYNIVCGVAQSIDYLHNECSKRVLHRDIKTSNIMLDAEFNACLGDFGLARMFKLSEKTHHTTHELAGTPPYMAPEIFLNAGKATVETDVYAFGVLVLEVVCGRKPEIMSADGEIKNRIVDWVWDLYRLDMICSAIDPKLKENYNRDEAECILLIGLACCNPNPYMRPSIRSAFQVLMGETIPPMVPYEKPAFVWPAAAPSLTREELDRSYSGGMLSTLGSFSGR
ncbi:hypothetical protein V2J09_013764 [Rumex salicifolius]